MIQSELLLLSVMELVGCSYRCSDLLLSLTVLLCSASLTGSTGDGAVREYCVNDEFQAKCAGNEVIVMKSALYGRMNVGRCAKKDYGFIGCGSSVMGVTDFLCSGRQQCSVRVPNEMFEVSQECPEDFKNYLEASYECVKVTSVARHACRNTKYITLAADQGVLGSVVTMETGCGSPTSPWIIRAKPGQRINVTLTDFYYGVRGELAHLFDKEPRDSTKCLAYAIFKEAAIGRTVTLCGGRKRRSHAYLSAGSELQIVMFGGNNEDAARYFLLNYTVVGCQTPAPPEMGWVRQEGDGLEWGCNDSSVIYTQTCRDGAWIGDDRRACSSALGKTGRSVHGKAIFNLTYDMAIAMIVAIALVIACLILCVGIIWLKRSREDRRNRQLNQPPVQSHADPYDNRQQYMTQQMSNYTRKEPAENLWAHYDQYRNGENIYASIQETPSTLPLPGGGGGGGGGGRKASMPEGHGHGPHCHHEGGYSREAAQSAASTPYSTLDQDTFHTFHFPPPMGAKPNAYSDTSSEHYRDPSRQYFTVDPNSGEVDISSK